MYHSLLCSFAVIMFATVRGSESLREANTRLEIHSSIRLNCRHKAKKLCRNGLFAFRQMNTCPVYSLLRGERFSTRYIMVDL